MNIVKHLKILNWRTWLKRHCQFWSNQFAEFFPTIMLGTLIGTYLDLYFVGKQFYSFPTRPLPEIFTVNVSFTLLGLPIFILFFLFMAKRLTVWGRAGLILILSLFGSILEKLAEEMGLFVHSIQWSHYYTFWGYFIYMAILLLYYLLIKSGDESK